MREKLTGYSVISILSFCVFTVIFHAVASAQTTSTPFFGQPTPAISPTPTIYVMPTAAPQQFIAYVSLTPTPTSSPDEQKSSDKKTEDKQPSPTPNPTDTPTPTPLPTDTPSPTPIPQPTISVVTDLESLFSKYADEYHIDKELLKKIARCESNFNTTSNNSGMYLGMFQFAASSWMGARTSMGVDPNPDLRTNAEESIRTAAYMLSMGRQSAWPNCH